MKPRSETDLPAIEHLKGQRRVCGTMSALRVPVLVRAEPTVESAIIGRGWFNVLSDGKTTEPTGVDLHGVELPSGQYAIQAHGTPMLVVLSKRVQ